MADDDDDAGEGRDGGLESLEARLTAPTDQKLAHIRDEYLKVGKEGQQALRQWVEQLVSANPEPLGADHIFATAQVKLFMHDGDGSEPGPHIIVSPETLLEAIRAWDQGQEYLPDMTDS
jgi:hypothetical protein